MFKKIVTVVGLVLAVAGCSTKSINTEEVVDMEPEIRFNASNYTPADSSVKVFLRDGGYCSGVVISTTQILTAAHCTDAGIKSVEELPSAHIVGWQPHPNKDLAIITVDSTDSIPFAKISAFEPARGSDLFLVGYGCHGNREVRKLTYEYPVINDWDLRDAETIPASETITSDFQNNLKTSGCSCAGDSGSAVYDSAGGLVAIHSATLVLDDAACDTVGIEVSIENLYIEFQ